MLATFRKWAFNMLAFDVDVVAVYRDANNDTFSFGKLVTASDIKKIAKEEDCTFLEASRDFIFAGTDDNGNNYYIDPDDAIQ